MAAAGEHGERFARAPRWDTGELSAPEKLANGWVRTQGRIGRVGIQEYVDKTGKVIRELRLPEEVFAPESMQSFSLVPLTNTHPPVLLDSTNAKFYAVGAISAPKQDGDWLVADLMIHEAEARQSAEQGRVQLSNGYECDLDPTQDPALVAKWGPYDFVQRQIRGNHCALVDVARAGPDARARMDASKDTRAAVVLASTTTQGERAMGQIRIDGLTLEVNDGNVAAIQTAIDKQTADLRKLIAGEATRADGAEKKAGRAFGLFDSLMAVMKRRKKRVDAMKARMMGCDECAGSGKVAGEDGAEKACDYCDGKGSFRMHDKFGDMDAGAVDPESEEHGEYGADPTDDDGDMEDADELQTERETEESGAEAVGKAKAPKKDSAERLRARRDARRDDAKKRAAAAKKARQDSLERRIKRGIGERSALVETAVKLLGPDFKSDGKTNDDIRKAVILKESPEAKLDGKSDEYVRARFDMAREKLQPISAADLMRAASGGNDPAKRVDTGLDPDKARQAMLERNKNIHAVKK